MKKFFIVTTGLGYIVDKKNIIVSKCEFPKGRHPIKSGYRYVEINSRKEFDAIRVPEPPRSKQEVREQKIQAEIRKMAEERLDAKGDL